MDEEHLIATDPDIFNGEPFVVGTTVPVNALIEKVVMGESPDVILRDYPVLSRKKLDAVLTYAVKVSPQIRPFLLKAFNRSEIPPVEQVFTPRNPEVNEDMYIERPELERTFLRGLSTPYQLIVHGDSGCGKSWLYKKLLRDRAIPFMVIDCANVALVDSFEDAFLKWLAGKQNIEKVSFAEEKGVSAKAFFAEGGLKHTAEFIVNKKDTYERILEKLANSSNGRQAVLVLENLEQVVGSDKLMRELGSYITLSDNEDYSQYNTKLLIVGTPSGIKDYYGRTPNQQTIANRLLEIPEVRGLSKLETLHFCRKGFIEQLMLPLTESQLHSLSNSVFHYTMGIPQRLHELCYHLAYAFDESDTNEIESPLQVAVVRWLRDSMAQFHASVLTHLSAQSSKPDSKNQVIYALGQITEDLFTTDDVENRIVDIFPSTCVPTLDSISEHLTHLSDTHPKMIESAVKLNAWRFTDRRYQMCIRAALVYDITTSIVSRRLMP